MVNRESTIQRVRELSLNGMKMEQVVSTIQQSEMAYILTDREIEELAIEAATAKSFTPRRTGRSAIRIVGIITVLAGLVGIWLGPGYTSRYSPSGIGVWAILFGTILIIKPGWSNESVKYQQPPR